MRNLFILFTLAAVVSGCDPYIDTYVPRDVVAKCNARAQGSLKHYKWCLIEAGCELGTDPSPFSNTSVFICDEN